MKTPGTKTGEFFLNYLNRCPGSLFYWIPTDIKLNHECLTLNAKPQQDHR